MRSSGVQNWRFYLVFALLCAAWPCSAETLRELLAAGGVPVALFSEAELSAQVQGSAGSDGKQVLVVYRGLDGERPTGPLRVVRLTKADGVVSRAVERMAADDVCMGSLGMVQYIEVFALLSSDISPSAECLLVIGGDLQVHNVLYGFSPVEVAHDEVVILEDMIHFAPVHPERLQLVKLTTGVSEELYPMKGDPLRARLINVHRKRMPAKEVCQVTNDPCDARLFDEHIQGLNTDGAGRFAFLALQSADHATAAEEPRTAVVSQSVLYVYQRESTGWRYCELEVGESQVQSVSKLLQSDFAAVADRCTPDVPVVPDLTSSAFNPFSRQ